MTSGSILKILSNFLFFLVRTVVFVSTSFRLGRREPLRSLEVFRGAGGFVISVEGVDFMGTFRGAGSIGETRTFSAALF